MAFDPTTFLILIKICHDPLLAEDAGVCAILVLLDLIAAFDTVDHNMLIDKLERGADITDVALKWFKSYPSNICFYVAGSVSPPTDILYGVPQGSILSPILLSIYMLPLSVIFGKHRLKTRGNNRSFAIRAPSV